MPSKPVNPTHLRRETQERQRQEANQQAEAARDPSNWSRRRVIRTAGLAAMGAVRNWHCDYRRATAPAANFIGDCQRQTSTE